jgi:hypothetical protein
MQEMNPSKFPNLFRTHSPHIAAALEASGIPFAGAAPFRRTVWFYFNNRAAAEKIAMSTDDGSFMVNYQRFIDSLANMNRVIRYGYVNHSLPSVESAVIEDVA